MSSATIIEPAADLADFYIDAPAPGLHKDVPYEVYERWPAVRSSLLSKLGQSPLHARYAMLHPLEGDSTKAKDFGHALHVAVLEPDAFPARYFKAPDVDGRTKDGKAALAAAREANHGKRLIKAEEYDQCIAMRDAVWSHPTAKEILASPGVNELSAVWEDSETGLLCKGRQDRFGSWDAWPTVVDLKSTLDASKRSFSKTIETYGYASQAAYYLDGFNALAPFRGGDRRYVLIAAEKDPPYAIAVYELESASIEIGRKRYRAHLTEWARCMEAGRFPAYGDGLDLISLPAWAFKNEGE